ncbi:hypothetical protein SAMN05877753_105222 [Bacillus oleivorans]|uniref:Uncharacterized protein n=1 Tax=Bacillus oleivorans TaxID=1448271 RepID=A0A285CWK6_9BACI|nr:hypothetical protein [Bacillus oleivorans]SNX71458.1 hypothetical protein SAMN05877753_105222 [Bacillus oleivorans]
MRTYDPLFLKKCLVEDAIGHTIRYLTEITRNSYDFARITDPMSYIFEKRLICHK